jgi:ketosteroid isomerase-like protein
VDRSRAADGDAVRIYAAPVPSDGLERLARTLFEAYGEGELDTMRSLLAEDLTAHITNADAGVDRVQGRDRFMSRLPDLEGAELSTGITQIVAIDDERVMTMIEVKAKREGRALHNFAAFLARVRNGQVAELWMVEAKPAYSDDFWS